jgi:hypothetical protein
MTSGDLAKSRSPKKETKKKENAGKNRQRDENTKTRQGCYNFLSPSPIWGRSHSKGGNRGRNISKGGTGGRNFSKGGKITGLLKMTTIAILRVLTAVLSILSCV